MSSLAMMISILMIGLVSADLYLHSPPGSNNRNRERKDNRNNANRLFDSQNNGKGGYPWRGDPVSQSGDPLTYYVNSKLRVEWTAQHGCGQNPNLHCELVIQASCEDDMPGVRDGYPQSATCWDSSNNNNQNGAPTAACGATNTFVARKFDTNTNEGTNTIPTGQNAAFYAGTSAAGAEYGMHENYEFYKTCETTWRNTRLYTSDQKLNGRTAKYTRQNPNGGRRGLECPEERDYYPYWRPTPWRDVAILVSNTTFCDYYQKNSANVQPRMYCDCQNSASSGNPCPITEAGCTQRGFVWKEIAAMGGNAPECLYHPFSRDNHLGNTFKVDGAGEPEDDVQPETAFYEWSVPEWAAGKQCVLRMRYNMSTYDYASHTFAEPNTASIGYDAAFNCPFVTSGSNCADGNPDCSNTVGGVVPACYTSLTALSNPLQNRPYINLFEEDVSAGQGFKLGLAINTHQTGRTFQDRSYVFRVEQPPASVAGKTIHNLGLRGRRGNIVQAYPAVEYDFTPSMLEVTQDDYLHISLHGSDFNAAKNANNGEGWKYSDRTNIVQMEDRHKNYPMYHTKISMFQDQTTAKKFAWGGQDPSNCLNIQNYDNNNEQNNVANCGKLNRMKNRFPQNPEDGLVPMSMNTGTYYYYSTRNNNFSNRSQKGQIKVKEGSSSDSASLAVLIAAAFGALFGFGVIVAGTFSAMKYYKLGCFAKKAAGQATVI